MSFEIKEIDEKDYKKMVFILQGAYAGSLSGSKEESEALTSKMHKLLNDDKITAIGAYEGSRLIACVLFYVFQTNFHNKMIKTAGIGSLAVDLLYKKKNIAKQLIHYSFDLARDMNIALFTLYPFNFKFYKKFGFGYGAPLYTYTVKAEHFRSVKSACKLEYARSEDTHTLIELHDKKVESSHGMSLKNHSDYLRLTDLGRQKIIMAKDQDQCIGYMIFSQNSLNQLDNQAQKLLVNEWFYTDRKALFAFADFLKNQAGQIDYIEFYTYDDQMHYLLEDISFAQAPKSLEIINQKLAEKSLGMMYKVLDPQKLLALIEKQVTYCIQFNIIDSNNNHLASYRMNDKLKEKVEISLEIHAFSSWIMGACSLRTLYNYEMASASHPNLLKTIDAQFDFDRPQPFNRF